MTPSSEWGYQVRVVVWMYQTLKINYPNFCINCILNLYSRQTKENIYLFQELDNEAWKKKYV